jgi:hypothetical protein
MFLRYTLPWLCLLAGCAGAQKEMMTTPKGSNAEVGLELHTAAQGEAGWQVVAPAASLASGAEFSLRVFADAPAYVYVGQRGASSAMTLLVPSAASAGAQVQVGPDRPTDLPDAGQWFRLDDQAGQEALFVLFSRQPQPLDSATKLLRERGDVACVKTRDPPPLDVKSRNRGPSVRGRLGDDGLTVLCFPIRHLAPP